MNKVKVNVLELIQLQKVSLYRSLTMSSEFMLNFNININQKNWSESCRATFTPTINISNCIILSDFRHKKTPWISPRGFSNLYG